MYFTGLTLDHWRQFAHVDIEMHPRITIITGANGAGKTTILKLLSQHFGWNYPLLATPKISKESGGIKYVTDLFRHLFKTADNAPPNSVGTITYSNNAKAHILVPETGGISYSAQISNQQGILGVHINSHRPLQSYQQINAIPTNAIGAEQAYQSYWQEVINKYQGGYTQYSPIYRMKESIISMATFGPGNTNVQKNPELEKLFLDFKKVLAKVLPPSIGFVDINIRIPDVVLVTRTGEFVLDAASGGLMAIIDLAWQIFLFSHNKDEFVVTIDEPENHLHPSMQRSLLRRLSDAFPRAQFIVATHSPFIVSSVKDSFVYALKYSDSQPVETDDFTDKKVSSLKLDLNRKAASAGEILRDVLGVPVTLPEWAEEDLRGIANEFSGQEVSEEMLNRLRERLTLSGLSEYFPDALKVVVGQRL